MMTYDESMMKIRRNQRSISTLNMTLFWLKILMRAKSICSNCS